MAVGRAEQAGAGIGAVGAGHSIHAVARQIGSLPPQRGAVLELEQERAATAAPRRSERYLSIAERRGDLSRRPRARARA